MMVYEKVCAICGKEFETKTANAKYCSAECKKVADKRWKEEHREEQNAKRRGLYLATCPVCGKRFTKTGNFKTYCSTECRREGELMKWRNRKKQLTQEKKMGKAMTEAMYSNTPLSDEKVIAMLDDYAGMDGSYRTINKAVSKSVKVRRKQNMLLLAQDAIEAEKLGLSYGQYQAMKGSKG